MMVFIFSITTALKLNTHTTPQLYKSTSVEQFEKVYKEHFAFSWRTMRAMGIDSEYIDDAVQEVFIVVHRRLDSYQQEVPFRSWLFGIIRRVASDYRRAASRKGRHVSLHENTLAAQKGNPHDAAVLNQALKIVEEFTYTLDEERRAIFVLSELEQMSVADISAAMDLNINTIYSRLKVMKSNLVAFVEARYKGRRLA